MKKSVSYAYTPAGLLATRTWARGIVTTYAYDAWNQLVSTTYSDSTPAVSVSIANGESQVSNYSANFFYRR